MSKSIPNRTRSPAVEGVTVATSRHAVEQFRLHLLERIPDAARVKLRSVELRGSGVWKRASGAMGKIGSAGRNIRG